ncbi:hypothetical protein, partial [Vibrio cholerae]|uniref:hypothetical protein n=1 Tax=Vibrio cholerae TaxID=666 RepID=UPI001CA38430
LLERSNALGVPMAIAFEVNSKVNTMHNAHHSNTEGYNNVLALHDVHGCVSDFLLNLCKVNNVKSEQQKFNATISNITPLTKH